MPWPLQYRIDRIPPASSSAITILPPNIVFPNSASSGNPLRVDSKRQRISPSGSVVVSESRAAFCANRASRSARRCRAASASRASAASAGAIFTGTGRGRMSSPIFTNTRWELSVTSRAPVLTSSAQTRTPTSSDDVPTYSTCAFRMAIWPTLTGWRKSMSSVAPRTTWPRATRPAASVPASVIHCIIRPPWIWPGAPACSGNTHWTISTTESAIDGIRALYHLVPRARASSAGFADAAFERGVRAPAFADAIDSIGGGFGRGAKPPPSASAPAALGSFDRDSVEVVEARRLQAQPAHAFPCERPVEAHVDRQPRQLLSEQDLGALVEPLPLGAKRELAGADQQAVELGIPVKGEVQGAWPLDRRLARRQREQEQVGVAPRHRRLEERQVVVAPLEDRACRVGRLESEGEVDALSGEGLAHLSSGEGHLLGLEREVADAEAGKRERALGAPRRPGREPDVERPRVELRLGLIVVIDLEEHEALGFRGRPPVAGHGLECQSSGGYVDDAVGTRADQACRAVTPGDDLDDPQARMGEHGDQRRVGLDEQDLHGACVGRPHVPDDAGCPPEEGGPDHRRPRAFGTELTGEAHRDLCRGKRGPVVKPHAVAQRERPREAVARDRPAGRERRLHVGRAVAIGDECVEDLARDEGDRPLERRGGIERRGDARHSDAHFSADTGRARCARRLGWRGRGPREDERQQNDGQTHQQDAHRYP